MFKATIVTSILLAVAVIGYTTFANTNMAVKNEISSEIVDAHKLWSMKHAKVYGTQSDHSYRLSVFAANYKKIQEHNAAGHSWTMGLNEFADLTQEEMHKQFTGLRTDLANTNRLFEKSKEAPLLNITGSPSSYDWRDHGAVNPVKNQGQCGSCWAFATVASIEGNNFKTNGELVSLSEQELVDCSTSDNGCGGGLPSRAYEDLIKGESGLELESAYPYQAVNGTCMANKSKEKVFLSSWTPVSQDEDQIAAALIQYGPLAIGINASGLQSYFAGIYDPSDCDPKRLDHAVTIVAYGVEDGKPYWTIRNSWGAGWGEEGNFRMVRGTGACGMEKMVTAAEVASKKL